MLKYCKQPVRRHTSRLTQVILSRLPAAPVASQEEPVQVDLGSEDWHSGVPQV